MTQKIEGSLPSPATLRTSSVSTKAASGASEEGKERAVGAAAATDSLRLTGEASGLQTLQRQLSAAPAVDSSRVDAVRSALQNGSYKINPDAIASRMIDMDRQLGA
ncbi:MULTISPECIES: flagellar biosynthesis anti-sigma factor FlgM [Xanthomonas]|uniref:Negative regulator of flagellin synthesis n=2 Tax=Xanthomonas TaxID=338 RepID=A0A6N7QJ62_9XANT|nr:MULTISPECIES: flagellar biosynthesis anti-sigma factor FlgM [Xanthomonas]AJC44705.1 flagellar protein [Xanthomonas sacchari]KAA8918694.1 flagellar biosynthesis anti-sigma factor FlgM [Xanthomonas sontii]KAB7766545.1 flagellar biosynthesis anti-sigma factor FlgM [Xanthomonas sp. LMG 12461]KAB7766644.1 flagellar biosynthesis anti-sigma factor FlgM [Xanthomonas sp. LMG 12462]KAB7772664.1 flagellar biosynthesis anti-sigma factor FlgM [Xanthomonas sp. LMG 12459]